MKVESPALYQVISVGQVSELFYWLLLLLQWLHIVCKFKRNLKCIYDLHQSNKQCNCDLIKVRFIGRWAILITHMQSATLGCHFFACVFIVAVSFRSKFLCIWLFCDLNLDTGQDRAHEVYSQREILEEGSICSAASRRDESGSRGTPGWSSRQGIKACRSIEDNRQPALSLSFPMYIKSKPIETIRNPNLCFCYPMFIPDLMWFHIP